MQESKSSEAELMGEISNMRAYIKELESRLRVLEGGQAQPATERQPRKPIDARIEFIGDFDVSLAKGVDLSEGGICFEVEDDLPIEMRLATDDREEKRRARAVWMRRKPEGGYLLGLQFIEEEDKEPF